MCFIGFFISKFHTWHCEVWWKIHCINHLSFPCFVYVYTLTVVIIQCGANIPSWIAMGWPIQEVCGFYISTTQVPVCSIGLVSQSNYHAIWNWSKQWWRRHDGKVIFRVLFSFCRTWCHSFRVKLVSDLHRTST